MTTLVPEVWIERDGSGLYVEVECRYYHATPRKWRAARRAQGLAAIVARTPKGREHWSRIAARAGWPGIATVLLTLRRRDQRPLWVRAWSAAVVPPATMERLRTLTE